MQQVSFTYELSEEQKKAKQERVKALLADARIQQFLIENALDATYVEAHSSMFSRWVETLNKCVGCRGLFFCAQSTKGKLLNLKYEKFMYNELVACAYQKAETAATAHMKQYVQHDLSLTLQKLTLEQIGAGLLEQPPSYQKALTQVFAHMDKGSDYGIYLYGKPGVGKTYLAAALANKYAKSGKSCAFINVPNFTSSCKLLMQEKSLLDRKLRQLKQVDVLVLDDIGGESVSPWIRDEILLPLLNERMEKNKLTFFTSNFDYALLESHYRSNSNGSDEPIKANRLLERIKALSVLVTMSGDNRRNVKKI
ncbi:MAG: ATP-binding protein [Erysipelotrichaceae bacterium]